MATRGYRIRELDSPLDSGVGVDLKPWKYSYMSVKDGLKCEMATLALVTTFNNEVKI